jgi:60 kDa SS-A/Ro ribonucleoprotein
MAKYNHLMTKNKTTSANEKIIGRENDMSNNNGGGVSFVLSKWSALDRFLNLGADSGTFYLSAKKHQYNNYNTILDCIKTDGVRVVKTLTEVSVNGLAHKNDHAIFALALCFTHGDAVTKNAASVSLNKVCRTGYHILMFSQFIKGLRGYGNAVRKAINNWYLTKSSSDLAFQISKYKNREGWTHRDVFRLTHPKFSLTEHNQIAQWAMDLKDASEYQNSKDEGLQLLWAVDKSKTCDSKELAALIKEYNLQREHISTEHLNDLTIQEIMLPNLGATALIRNLGNMSKSGLLKPLSKASKFVISKLNDDQFLRKGKIHPLSLYIAAKTYSSGRGLLGSGSWNVDPNVAASIEKAFYHSFNFVEPTNKNYFFGLDVSGSMTSTIGGTIVSCHEVATIIGLTMTKVEPYTFIGGFSNNFIDLGISSNDSLSSALSKTYRSNFGSTNPGSAIEYAINNKIDVDTFVFITDNEVNTGSHPSQVLAKYRQTMNKPNCKMIVVGLTATNFSIADPNDPLMLDIAGFSPDITTIITNFSK